MLLHCVFRDVPLHIHLVLFFIAPEHAQGIIVQSVVRVRVVEERADGNEQRRNVEYGYPVILQNVEADTAIRRYVWVVHRSEEADARWLERVLSREVDLELECARFPYCPTRTVDLALPLCHCVLRDEADAIGWLCGNLLVVGCDATRHFLTNERIGCRFGCSATVCKELNICD